MSYPFVKCLNPQFVRNKYTGETILSSCGKCEACANRKASLYTLKCQLESESHAYCMFVTLTYNQVSIPLMMPKYIGFETYTKADGSTYIHNKYENDVLVELTPRLGRGTILGTSDLGYLSSQSLLAKCQTFNLYPHLSKRDLQLFIKRLRKHASKISTDKIRYFAAGEYGPVHFRPHYHLLLWFSDKTLYKAIHEIIHKSWSYGRIDVETSRGKSASYVAKYVTSNSVLPRIFKQKSVSPFCLHSAHLGEMVLKQDKETIYQQTFEDFSYRCCQVNDNHQQFFVWSSLSSWYFPKCKGFSTRTSSLNYYAYRLYATTRDWTKKTLVANQARYILNTLFGVFQIFGSTNQFHSDPLINDLLCYFVTSCDINLYDTANYDKYYRRIYMELRLSKHFLKNICDGDERYETIIHYMDKITDFYTQAEKYHHKYNLEQQEEFDFESEEDYVFFYPSGHEHSFELEKLTNSSYYRSFKANTEIQTRKRLKHKELNDANGIFLNYYILN